MADKRCSSQFFSHSWSYLLPLMKHFLKPLGHCLTTAVMTSAMLRVYALPPVEAATPDVDPQSASDTATSEGAAALAAPNLSVSAPVAQPETIGSVESAPVLEPAVVPMVSPAEPVASVEEPVPAPVEALPAPAKEQIAPAVGDAKPDAASPSADKPEADASSALGSEAEDAKQTPTPSTQTPDTSSARTVGGMRQIVEKRLGTIVEQDKESRNAKWQQSLIQVALEYAWQGKFDAARKVAANPALPLDLQISLLGKIAAIETEFLASQVAQLPNSAGNQPQSTKNGSATPQGRNVPAGYATVDGAAAGYAGISFDNRCPVLESPSKAISLPQTSPRPTVAAKKTTGVPNFVPALGQNLASRLADLSQTQSAPSATKPVVSPPQLVSSQLFAGVAASSVRVQPSSVDSPPQVGQARQLEARPPKVEQPARQSKATQSRQLAVESALPPEVAEHQFAKRLFPSQLPSQPQITESQSLAATTATANLTVRQIGTLPARSQPQATLSLEHNVEPFEFAFPELFDRPLDWVWNWWNVPTQEVQPSGSFASRSTPQLSSGSLPFAAELGLTNPQLFQTIEQDLTTALQPLRNARKLSISLPSTKNVSLKAPLKTSADPGTLLAIRCGQAYLGQSSWTNALISPANAKQFGWVNFLFPLPIPAVITSAFGWRTHPISGDLRFHTGLDIGAPMGTPVLSAAGGRVVVADAMGGYGLAVVVENETTQHRNLYAHLSGIAVQPGATVKPGTVLGWVGSTGNSTGPHLHFESQVKTETGWTVIDPLASAAVATAERPQN